MDTQPVPRSLQDLMALHEQIALRPRKAARALDISPRTLWGLSAPRGPIPCVRVGSGTRRTVLYSTAALQKWLDAAQAAEGGTNDAP
jgi:hypothetical protein